MTNSSPWLSHGPNRNRWFTYLKLLDLSMAMLVITRGHIIFKLMFFLWDSQPATFDDRGHPSARKGTLTRQRNPWMSWNTRGMWMAG